MTTTNPTYRPGDVVDATWRDGEVTRGVVVGYPDTKQGDLHLEWVTGETERLASALELADLRVVLNISDVRAREVVPAVETRVHLEQVVADLTAVASDPTTLAGVLTVRECRALAGFLQDLCDMHDEQAIDLALWPTAAEFARHYLFELDENGDPL